MSKGTALSGKQQFVEWGGDYSQVLPERGVWAEELQDRGELSSRSRVMVVSSLSLRMPAFILSAGSKKSSKTGNATVIFALWKDDSMV